MNIGQIIDKINDSQLFVPAFQREYVWKRNNVKELFDSLIKKYPTGTLLTWETTSPPELKGKRKYNAQMGAIKLILDGQQRITTLYLIMEGKIPPYYTQKDIKTEVMYLYVNLLTLELEYYKPKTMANNPIWVNLTDIFTSKVRSRTIREQLEKLSPLEKSISDKIDDNFDIIKSIKEREFVEQIIPVTANIKNAIDIFYIVNASGVNLTDAELALAQISGYWPEAREVFKQKLHKLAENGFVFKLDFIIFALLGIIYRIGSEMKKLHSIENRERIQQVWKRLDGEVLDYVVNLLRGQAYVDHTDEINSVYALIPLIVYVHDQPKGRLGQTEAKKAIKWFYYSQIRQRYVSQVQQKLDKDLSIIATKNNPFDELLSLIKSERTLEITKDEFVGKDVRHPLFNLMKWYFKSRNAICLGTGLCIRKNMGKKYELENDHIFAYSILKNNGYDKNSKYKYALAQEITNRAILTKVENRTKSDQCADVYLKKVAENYPTALKLQVIPEKSELWKLKNFEEFLEKRRIDLAEGLNSFLNKITTSDLSDAKASIEDMIDEGENACLEFKASLRWSYDESCVDKKLEAVILKTIAAFNNSDGGLLLIGVADDGGILGLENDYNNLDDGDKDTFELYLRNLLNSVYGKEYASRLVISFPLLQSKEICAIDVAKGNKPIFTLVTDKFGQKQEKFYIRSGNSSQELMTPSEITNYIASQFE